MKKLLYIGIVVLFILVGGYVVALMQFGRGPQQLASHAVLSDPKNISYTIDGVEYPLANGVFAKAKAQGSVSISRVSIFGEPVQGDLDGDGDADAALTLVYDPGGSGTFFYVVLAINDKGVYRGTNGILLGDRIAPQTLEIHYGKAVANIVVRKPGQSFSDEPTVGKSVWVALDTSLNTISEGVSPVK